jgi:HlyD family secretion protein
MDVSIQEQGVISLDSTLLTEIYVSPHRIGYFYSKMPVKVQINSFPCNDWGMIVGEVEEISPDYFLDSPGKNAYYKVKCRLEKDYLENKNGMKSMLKKEMSVKSHFTLTRRSLFDLLYQKFNDWTNPNDTENNRYSAYEKNN